ncbi:MAG: SWIM zinc finger family protein [Blastocatellia bacterium]
MIYQDGNAGGMKTLDRKLLIELAGARAFKRGEEYFARRRVRALAADGEKITAFVYGGKRYRAAIMVNGEEVGYECDCPEGASARFCKHCVAVGLNWLEDGANGASSSVTWHDVRGYLANLPPEELARLALDEAMRNAEFRERLWLRAARAGGKSPDRDEYRGLLEFASQSATSEENAESFHAVLSDIESSLNNLIEAGYAEDTVSLIEQAPVFNQPRQTEASEKLIAVLLTLHHKSCLQSGIAAEALAERLLRWQLSSLAIGAGEVMRRYADKLGRRGRDAYERLVQSEWDRLRSNGDLIERARFTRLAELLEQLAERHGDIDLLIAVRSHRLEDASGYLEIARLCKRKGRKEIALQWALRGKKLFAACEAEGLYEFLAAEYEARGEWKEAIEILFELFSARPTLGCYQRMAACGRQIGEWGLWQERALSVSRRNQFAHTRATRSSRVPSPDLSALVSILLWEDDQEAAWEVARQGGCDDDLWQELAKRMAAKQPDESLRIYKRLVEKYADGKNSYAYEQAIELLRGMGRLMKKQKRRDEFLTYVKSLREKHRNRHSFAKLLDRLLERHSRKRNGSFKSPS